MGTDCILCILRFIDDGCLYKNLLFTCKLFRDFFRTGFMKDGVLWNHICWDWHVINKNWFDGWKK